MILPAVALATIPLSIIARITRSALLEVMGKDYIRTARAKGVKESTWSGATLSATPYSRWSPSSDFSSERCLVERFSPKRSSASRGVGRALFDAITGRDYAIVQGFTVVVASGYVIVNLLVDLSYAYLDPRIRLE